MKKVTLKLIVSVAFYCTLAWSVETYADSDKYIQWQLASIHSPSEKHLSKESKGWIAIYDGLTDRQVLNAMDKQFNRVEHMMFVNTRVTNSTGEVLQDSSSGEEITEDDGC